MFVGGIPNLVYKYEMSLIKHNWQRSPLIVFHRLLIKDKMRNLGRVYANITLCVHSTHNNNTQHTTHNKIASTTKVNRTYLKLQTSKHFKLKMNIFYRLFLYFRLSVIYNWWLHLIQSSHYGRQLPSQISL